MLTQKATIACTDLNWFDSLSKTTPNLINFWTPTPWNTKIEKGDIFFFLLKSPIRKIGGYGIFSMYKNMSTKEAWSKYGRNNGVNNLFELDYMVKKYAKKNSANFESSSDSNIGCIILKNPIFLDKIEYIKPEEHGISFSKHIVKYKRINEKEAIKLLSLINISNKIENDKKFSFILPDKKDTSYISVKQKKREGQSIFRQKIMQLYKNKCCICEESNEFILEAAHITPYVNENSNHIKNGILIRVDFHKLFDAGLITIKENYHIKLSPHLSSTYYKIYDNKKISLPDNKEHWPAKEALIGHGLNIFRK